MRKQFLGLAGTRQARHRQLVDFDAFHAQFARNRIAQPAFGIMFFDRDDGVVRLLRGGEYYKPQGSKWYFPDTFRNDEHGKLLLMAPGYDRSGGVGFRCVRDAK